MKTEQDMVTGQYRGHSRGGWSQDWRTESRSRQGAETRYMENRLETGTMNIETRNRQGTKTRRYQEHGPETSQ